VNLETNIIVHSMRNKMKAIVLILGLVTGLLTAPAAMAKVNVVATTSDFGAVAREIGGDRVDVSVLAKPTEDPHFVDAKPNFIVKLNRADAVIEGGAELELGWLPPLLEGARNPKLDSGKPGHISCLQGIALMEVPSTLDRSKGDIHAAGNPHYTTDPIIVKTVAATIAEGFSQIDPKSAGYFKANLEKFNQKMDAKVAEWQKLLAPYKGRKVVTYHNSWPYFARRFDLSMDVFLEPKPGIPPTPSHLVEVIGRMKSENIRVIIVEPYLNRRTAETVANRTEAAIVDVAPYPGAGKHADESYTEWMDSLVHQLVTAFAAAK
jgi:zinc/manganese transport system substrate-binding protein